MFEGVLSMFLIEINLGSQIPVVTGGFDLRTSSMQEQSPNPLKPNFAKFQSIRLS